MKLLARKEMTDKGRFDAFTDGVFAVAITLMVLEVHVPELKRSDDREMRAFLATLPGPILTYILSFATVGIIWMNHHVTFASVRTVNRGVNTLNLALLAVVCFLPFPTALVARYGPLPSSTALYGATFTVMSIAYFAVWQYAVRCDPEAPPMTPATAITGGIGTLFYAAGTLLAFVHPRLAIGIYVGVALYYALPGLFTLRGGTTGEPAA